MDYDRLRQFPDVLLVSDIAPILGVNPQSIRAQAQKDVRQLGFPASVIGTRVLIPRDGFINWLGGAAWNTSAMNVNGFSMNQEN